MTGTAAARARGLEFWTQAAPGWIRHADHQDEFGRPLGAAAMTWLRPAPGERVLDVGCGVGGTTAELAARVAPGGEAVGIDLAQPMVDAARTRFATVANLRFEVCDIEMVDAVPGAPFDAVFSRMALMLPADPVAGCAGILRCLRPGGRLAATVFRDSAANPWLAAALLGAAAHVGPLPALPVGDDPGPFAFADAARPLRILATAGFEQISVQARDVTLPAPEDPAAVAESLIEVGPAGAAYRAASADERARARRGAARLLERFREPGTGYRFPAGIWLITATRPISSAAGDI
ncbi:class I SAM-dependent methyltransferase [Sphaerimonospora sp. CA-214678]|uniref:class I SAM-dependent methyltransferase n=1 Tax=Sphaerimonospora sp. CA-214678 TaxID=3240029 RepID=UPI003D9432FB